MAPSVDSSVLELRLRLYRPHPPEGAVEAYLAAIHDVTPLPPEERARPHRSRRHALAAAAVTIVVLALATAGLGMARQAAAAAAAAAHVSRTAAASALVVPPVPGRPIGELMGGAATTGLFDARGVRAVVSVLCSGDGTIALRIGDEPPVVLTCQAGGPALAMLQSTEDLERFTLSVAPQPRLSWSLAVGAMALPAS